MSRPVHWEQGLLLRPQHLQRMQKAMQDWLAEDRRLGWVWPYGVVEAKLLDKGLKGNDVQFESLRVIMPSGRIVDYPEAAQIDQPLHIKDSFVDGKVRVFLAVPVWQSVSENTLKSGSKAAATEKVLYQTDEEMCPDENTGTKPVQVKFRRVRARLMTGSEDHRGYETLELLRVIRDGDKEQTPAIRDTSFIPPTLVLNGCSQLRNLLKELLEEAQSVRNAQALKIKNAGFTFKNMQVAHLESLLRLQALNRHLPGLQSLHKTTGRAAGVAPYQLYLALSSFLGDLASLRLGHVEFDERDYNHDDAWPVFALLCAKIQAFLASSEGEKTLDVPFVQMGRYLTATLTEEHVNLPTTSYYLSIKTEKDPNQVSQFVRDVRSFKLLSRSMVDNNHIVPGIIIVKPEYTPPSLAPGERDIHVFQLDITQTIKEHNLIWERVREDRRIAIVQIQNAPVDLSKAGFLLRMTKPADAVATGG